MALLTPCVSLRWMIREQGLGSFCRWLVRAILYYTWLHVTPAGRRELHFDAIHGTSTNGYVSEESLGLSADSIHYAPIKPSRFMEAVGHAPIEPQRFAFIDIGSGKGRALLMAKSLGFNRLIGVEFSASLAAVAKSNLRDAEIHITDALEFDFPPIDSVVFLFNPFWRPTMDYFIENLDRSLESAPRKVYVVYVNPFCMNVVDRSRTLRRTVTSIDRFAIYESLPMERLCPQFLATPIPK